MEFLLPLILLLPLVLIITRTRKQQREFRALQAQLQPGQAIVTTAGLHGTVSAVDGDVVVLEVADGVRLRWARAGIGQILKAEADPAAITPAEAISGAAAGYRDDGSANHRDRAADSAGESDGRRAV